MRCFLLAIAIASSAACSHRDLVWGQEGGPMVVERTLITEDGGRVSWCHEADLIAFDREYEDGGMDVYTVRPDGTDERCVTCDAPGLPTGIRGQPAWHPGCDYMLLAVQGQHYGGTRFEHVAWGIHDDLWAVAADGSWAELLVEVPWLGATLHPQFSDSGEKVFWTARESTGETVVTIEEVPGDENQWDGWYLSIADWVAPEDGGPRIENRQDLYTDTGGFYESHGLIDDRIWYSHTEDGAWLVDEGFSADLDGEGRINHTQNAGGWEEHVDPSPNGGLITFNSSRHTRWNHPPSTAASIELEIHALTEDGEVVQLTRYADEMPPLTRAVTSDYAWGPNGRYIASYHVEVRLGRYQQIIEVLELDRDW
jgi:hypothetical protein